MTYRLTARRHAALAWALVAALATLAWPSPARAIELLNGLGGPAGYGPNNLPANDDGSTAELDVTAAFPAGLRFFGMTYRSLYLNNNGNISFGGSNGTFTPQAFPVSDLRMIAPWWGDVDTRGAGFPPPAHNGVYWSITPGRFVATWHDVGYYNEHDDKENDFQLILTAAGPGVGDFDVEFRYHQCQWTTGDASSGSMGLGGTPAQAGFDAGDRVHYVSIRGSLTMAVLQLCVTSNVAVPGDWRFAIRSGEVMCPGMGMACNTGRPGVCAAGTITCMGTTPVCTANLRPSPEVCNGLDNDCDGVVGDGIPPRPCYDGPVATRRVGVCRDGTQLCADGRYGACTGQVVPHAELCNGLDDDCNGRIDDGLGTTTCGEGTCQRVVQNCIGAVVQTCVPGEPVGSMGCFPQEFGPEPEPEAGTDGSTDATLDGGPASTCHDYHCDPSLQLNGRAGPFGGCSCSVPAPAGDSWRGSLVALAFGLAGLLRRRRAP